MNYVLGFAFDKERKHVALILKNRGPAELIGKLNGIGGKVNPSETYYDAMSREFLEETGVHIPRSEWTYKGSFGGNGYSVKVFTTSSDEIFNVRSAEDESVHVIHKNFWVLPEDEAEPLAPNVQTLLNICLSDHIKKFTWTE